MENALARSLVIIVTAIIILTAGVGAFSFLYLTRSPASSSAASYSTFVWNNDFVFSINYSGSWIANYQGYVANTANNNNATITGMGLYSKTLTMTATGFVEMWVCATAIKEDNSSQTLYLSIDQNLNSTSQASATVVLCETVAP